jgi:hypothetical protein
VRGDDLDRAGAQPGAEPPADGPEDAPAAGAPAQPDLVDAPPRGRPSA